MRLATVERQVSVNVLKPEWMERASCHAYPVELFFPEAGDSKQIIKEAKKVCADCPVRKDCLNYALGFENLPGIWGGKTQRERRKLYIPHTTPNG